MIKSTAQQPHHVTSLVLAPLDRVEVDTLLDKLPQGRKLTKEANTLRHSLEHVVDLLLGGEPADTETDTGVSALITVAQGTENVTGLQRSRSASTARRKSNVLEGHEERLTLDVGERNVHAAGVEVVGITVLAGVLHGEQTVEKTVGEVLDTLGIVLLQQLASVIVPNDARRIGYEGI